MPRHAILPTASTGKILQDDGDWVDNAGGADPTAEIEAAVLAHDVDPDCHDGVLSPVGHTHAAYSLTSHDHDGTYATAGHDHTGTYQPVATVLTNTTAKAGFTLVVEKIA